MNHLVYALLLAGTILATLVVALPASPKKANSETEVKIIKNYLNKTADGGYVRETILSNGQIEREVAKLVTIEGKDKNGKIVKRVVLIKTGEYEILDSETGEPLKVKYTADQNGFHAEGDHLPKPPKPEDEEDDYYD